MSVYIYGWKVCDFKDYFDRNTLGWGFAIILYNYSKLWIWKIILSVLVGPGRKGLSTTSSIIKSMILYCEFRKGGPSRSPAVTQHHQLPQRSHFLYPYPCRIMIKKVSLDVAFRVSRKEYVLVQYNVRCALATLTSISFISSTSFTECYIILFFVLHDKLEIQNDEKAEGSLAKINCYSLTVFCQLGNEVISNKCRRQMQTANADIYQSNKKELRTKTTYWNQVSSEKGSNTSIISELTFCCFTQIIWTSSCFELAFALLLLVLSVAVFLIVSQIMI